MMWIMVGALVGGCGGERERGEREGRGSVVCMSLIKALK